MSLSRVLPIALISVALFSIGVGASAAEKPNIVYILVDNSSAVSSRTNP